MKARENQRPLTKQESVNGQNCRCQQEESNTAHSIDKYSIGKHQDAFRKSLHLGTTISRGLVSTIVFGLVVALPQVAHADITTISTPTTSRQGPDTPPLNGGDTLIITDQGAINVTGGPYAVRGMYSNNTIDNKGAISINTDNAPGITIEDNYDNGINSNSIINSGSLNANGDGVFGVVLQGSNSSIANLGQITIAGASILASTGGRGIYGMYLDYGGSNTISNSGTISINGISEDRRGTGINSTSQSSQNTIVNTGLISVSLSNAYNAYGNGIEAYAPQTSIVNSGSISISGSDQYASGTGIFTSSSGSITITNTGSISATGNGIYQASNSGTLTNTGSISATGIGISLQGDSNTITNSETGSIQFTNGNGIDLFGNQNTITNTGAINGTGTAGISLYSSEQNTITNSGSIIVAGVNRSGIYSDFSRANSITNSGFITVAGAGGYGINLVNSPSSIGSNTIDNSGAINVSGTGGYGIYAHGNANTITNSGIIVSSNGHAIYFDGSGNTLNILNGSIKGDINMGSGGVIMLANGITVDLGGVISGTNGITFSGSGSASNIILSGINTYTGATTVTNGAKLSINGSIASSSGLTVNAGDTIGGSGSLPQTNLVAGATIAPGNSIGTVTALGLSLNGGTIDAEIQGPQNDRINVTGQVTNFTGNANLIPYGGGSPWPNLNYTIISAPTSTGFATSSSLTLDQSAVTSALLRSGTSLIQNADGDPKTFDVQWQPTNGTGATTSAMQTLGQSSSNQLATAGALDSVFRSLAISAANNGNNTGTLIGSTGFTTGQAAAAGITAEFLSGTSQLLSLTSTSQLTAAINSLSPEPYAAFQSVGLDTLKRQRELLLGQAGTCTSTGWVVNAPSSKQGKQPKQPLCVFAKAANATSSINGQNGLSSYDSGIFSTYYGVEVKPAKPWTIGVAYGYGSSFLNGMSLANAVVRSAVNSGSIYGVYKPSEAWTIRALLGYSNFNGTASRNVAAIGNGSAVTASPSANGYTASINADYLIWLTPPTAKTAAYLKPLLGIAWGGYQQDGFAESSNGAWNLNVNGHTANSLLGTVGLELAFSPIALNRSKTTAIKPRLAIAYQVDALGNDSGVKSLTASFAQAPAAGSFTTQGQNRGVNTLTIDGGIDLQVASNASLYANVGYETFSSGSQFTYGGGLKVKF